MFFKPKFFLDLSGDEGSKESTPAKVTVAPVADKPSPAAKPAQAAPKTAAAPAASTAVAPVQSAEAAEAAAPAASGLTTAEAIAAELAAAAASRPAPSLQTFATDYLLPGASPARRRRGGANLAGFRAMARSYVRN